jgi:transposase
MMSLNAPLGYVVPEETARVAQAAFPKGTRYMQMRDVFGPIYSNPAFAHLFPHNGQPAEDPARLALVLMMRFGDALIGNTPWPSKSPIPASMPRF